MRRPVIVWAAVLGGLAVFDILCDRRKDNSTLSCVVRATFRTDTLLGAALFMGAWAGLTAWICPHICRLPRIPPTT